MAHDRIALGLTSPLSPFLDLSVMLLLFLATTFRFVSFAVRFPFVSVSFRLLNFTYFADVATSDIQASKLSRSYVKSSAMAADQLTCVGQYKY